VISRDKVGGVSAKIEIGNTSRCKIGGTTGPGLMEITDVLRGVAKRTKKVWD